MNLLKVIPLIRSKLTDELSYFTAAEVPVGAIVTVPIRSKYVHAIVSESKNAEEAKMDIRNAPYEIRRLQKIKAVNFFPVQFMEACKTLADYYATNIGAVIDSLVSDLVLENASRITPPLPIQPTLISETTTPPLDKPRDDSERLFAIQGDDADRISSWRSLIRQEFARKKSLVFCIPTIEDGEHIFAALEKGIEGYIFKLNGGQSKKKVVETWDKIARTDHPVVVVVTPSFVLLPRGDFQTFVIERENGRGWISMRSPYMNMRHAVEIVARKRGQTIYIADSMLKIETLYRLDRSDISAGSPFKWRSISTARDFVIDMRKKSEDRSSAILGSDTLAPAIKEAEEQIPNLKEKEGEPPFRVLSRELEALIEDNSEGNTHLFIFNQRRGASPVTVCDDCETVVVCNHCGAPVVIHNSRESGRNFFMCHKCGEKRPIDETCANCGGWRLTPLGIGTDLVAETIAERFPETKVFRIDADSTKTEKQIYDTIRRFSSTPGSVLLGTEMALPYLPEYIDYAAVSSLDSLFALPDFRIEEKIMYLLIRLRGKAIRTFLLQTRKPEEKIFEYGLKGNISDFYRMTREERKQFSYPPFTDLVKITIEGKKESIAKEMGQIQEAMAPYEVDIFPAFTPASKGKSIIHGLIKVEHGRWPDMALVERLRALPLKVTVKINPDSLL